MLPQSRKCHFSGYLERWSKASADVFLRFQLYKPDASLKVSRLRRSKKQISFSFVFERNWASGNMKNSTFLSAFKIVLFGTCRTPVLDEFFDWKLTNCNVSLAASMSMWLINNFCFSLRSNEKRAARHVWKSLVYGASKKCVLAHVAQLALDRNCDSKHENDHERLPTAVLTCCKNSICFSLRSNEKRAARHVWKSVVYGASKKCVLAHVAHRCLMDYSIESLQIAT